MPSQAAIVVAMLLLARIAGLMVLMPVFGSRRIPAQFRVYLSFCLMLVLYPVAARHSAAVYPDGIVLVLTMLLEFLVGLVFGFTVNRIMAAVEYAGQLIGLQTGVGMMSLLDPTTGSQAQLFSIFETMFASIVFVTLDLHHMLIRALADSLKSLPLGTASLPAAPLLEIALSSCEVFMLAIRLASPIMIALFVSSLALAVMARAFPQMNAFMLSFPINISLGFFMLSTVAGLTYLVIGSSFAGAIEQALSFVAMFGAR